MQRPVIGILTWRRGTSFQEPGYLRTLTEEGKKLGALVYLFSHEDVRPDERRIRGLVPAAGGGWKHAWFPWPDVVIDRCRKGSEGYRRIRRGGLFPFVNSPYTKKWNATQLFMQEASVKHWIPRTVPFSPAALGEMLKTYPIVYVKPGNGTGGRSILQIKRVRNGFKVRGRSRSLNRVTRTFAARDALTSWVNRWVKNERIRGGSFMIQQGLDLEIIPGRVADVRLLIQKNGRGEWEVTGLGVRLGPSGSPTSNLHGGGRAVSFRTFLSRRFSPEEITRIEAECREMALALVDTIERHFGPMMEFGLDIGVDVQGRVWLIEVNPKPGRDLFRRLGGHALYRRTARRPMEYAIHLIHSQRMQK